MAWLKRNLGLVITSVIALGLLGYAGFFLWTKKGAADAVSAELTATTEKAQQLFNRNPGISAENINAAKEDLGRIEKFLTNEVKLMFRPPAVGTNLTMKQFGIDLDTTVDSLRRAARHSGVKLPSDTYQFSFASQAKAFNTPTNALETLALQLAEVDAICRVLFNAKVNELERIKRAPVTNDETAGTEDFVTTKGVTNANDVVIPYEVAFKGFSSDLAQVLEGFVKAKPCIVVRDVVVQRADAPQTETDSTSTGMGANPQAALLARYGLRPGMPGMNPALASRYGLRAPPPAAPAPAPAATPGRRSTVLEEKLLRITLSLDTVRLKPAGAVPTKASKPAAAPADPAAQPGGPSAPAADAAGTEPAN